MLSRKVLATACASLLLGASIVTAQALEVNLGGLSITGGSTPNSGTALNVGLGQANTNVTLGGGQNIAKTSVTVPNAGLGVGVGTQGGPLIGTTTTNGVTTANVNLGLGGQLGGTVNGVVNGVTGTVGSILDGTTLPGGPGGPGGPGVPGGPGAGPDGPQLVNAYGSLSSSEQSALKMRCRSVLMNPAAFDKETQQLCALLKRLGVGI